MDRKYWNYFYSQSGFDMVECSNFCKLVLEYFSSHDDIKYILDAGCGNGRDSYGLCKRYEVVGVDNSGFIPKKAVNVEFLNGDFVSMDKTRYDLIYSRFTFHSITNEQQQRFLETIPVNKYLAVEARSMKGEVDDVYHGKDHFRNYVEFEYMKKILENNGFEILYIEEGINMAIYKNENPVCIRVLCKKLR